MMENIRSNLDGELGRIMNLMGLLVLLIFSSRADGWDISIRRLGKMNNRLAKYRLRKRWIDEVIDNVTAVKVKIWRSM